MPGAQRENELEPRNTLNTRTQNKTLLQSGQRKMKGAWWGSKRIHEPFTASIGQSHGATGSTLQRYIMPNQSPARPSGIGAGVVAGPLDGAVGARQVITNEAVALPLNVTVE